MREAFLAKHPDVPQRLAELGRAIEHEEQLQRRQSYGRILRQEQAHRRGTSHKLDNGIGIDL